MKRNQDVSRKKDNMQRNQKWDRGEKSGVEKHSSIMKKLKKEREVKCTMGMERRKKR